MSDKLEALKALADEIAPGYRQKWGCEDGINDDSISVGTYNADGDICPFIEVSISDWSGNDDDNEKLAKFITLANPPVVSELLAALEEINRQMISDAVDAEYARLDMKRRAEAAEQREEHLKATVDVLSAKNAELQQRLATLPADWSKDSSLATWFPLTAARLAELEQRLQQPIKLPKREIGMACEFVSDHIVVSLAAVLAEAATAGFKAEVEGE